MAKRSTSMARSVCNRSKLEDPFIGGRAAVDSNTVEGEVMEYEAAIWGGGPSGLACAIRLKQLKPEANICVLEKASAIGAQALSGAGMEPGPLDALLPQWRESPPAICVQAQRGERR